MRTYKNVRIGYSIHTLHETTKINFQFSIEYAQESSQSHVIIDISTHTQTGSKEPAHVYVQKWIVTVQLFTARICYLVQNRRQLYLFFNKLVLKQTDTCTRS